MKGNPITTPEQLLELAANKKSVLIECFNEPYRVPASTLLYRQFRETMELLNTGSIFEYIKEPKRNPDWFIKLNK